MSLGGIYTGTFCVSASSFLEVLNGKGTLLNSWPSFEFAEISRVLGGFLDLHDGLVFFGKLLCLCTLG